jgi:hypothetical protein
MNPTDPALDPQLIADFGLADLPPEQQIEVAAKIGAAFERRIARMLSEHLSDAQTAQLSEYIDHDPEAADAYLHEQLPEYGQLLRDEYDAFKEEYLAIIGQLSTPEADR